VTKVSIFANKWTIPRWSRAGLLCAVALSCLVFAGQARAEDDEDDEPFETRIMKAILGVNDGDGIDYRERAPLVVPPSMNLVPPDAGKIDHPAWPKDADVEARKKRKATAAKQPRIDADRDGRPLTPAELNVGQLPRGSRANTPASANAELEGQRKMKPDELGYKGGLFDSLFRDTSKPEVAEFTGEAPRSSLTEPPPGYMTPSASQPYGLTPTKQAPKPFKLEDRGTN